MIHASKHAPEQGQRARQRGTPKCSKSLLNNVVKPVSVVGMTRSVDDEKKMLRRTYINM